MRRALVVFAIGCSSTAPPAPTPTPEPAKRTWTIPEGWKSETIPFPLEFAPSLAHQGVEELRFPPGFLKADSPNRWSYAFEWRLSNAADLDAAALAAELTAYFRGLLVAVDGEKKRFDPDAIVVTATKKDGEFLLEALIFDAFVDAAQIDLQGSALRTVCGKDLVVWRFVFAPASSPIRTELEALAGYMPCG